MNKFNQLKKVISYAAGLIDKGCDCSCEYSHFGCSTMDLRHGFCILENIQKLKKISDLNDDVLKSSCTPYMYKHTAKISDLK